jgi:hypothetical protein
LQRLPRLLALASIPLLALLAAEQAPQELVPLAACEQPAELAFEVRERGGGPVPARLTFVPPEGGAPVLFPNTAAAPHELAARDNVLYSRTGAARITVPPGHFTVFASRGPEWSLASREVELGPGEKRELALELVHELATPGWISADFHLHTLTYSGHGDANLEERVLSCLGEGLEFAVATDHDHHTDYRPTMRALGLEGAFGTVTGDEVSTPIGHFNAFPLDPARPPVDSSLRDAGTLFRLLAAETNAFGVVPVIQLNHPRLAGIDYFAHTGLDPVTGTSSDPHYSRAFDSIEILNENRALGYLDPIADRQETHGHRHSALRDWFHLLDQGERYAAVGNSDSRHVRAIVAGYPRNFVRVTNDEPARVQPAEVAAAVRAKQLFTTTGPFVEFSVAGAAMGGEARATDGHARLAVHVRAASWVDCDRVKVFVNGALAATLPIAASRTPERLETELELCFLGACPRHGHSRSGAGGPFDAWVLVVVEGDDGLAPILSPEARPLAVTNPVWVDGDADGRWTSPRERIAAELHAQATPDLARDWFAALLPAEQALAVTLAPRGPFAAVLVEAGFASHEREVRLAAARAAERHVLPGSLSGVQRAWSENLDDPFLGALLLRVLVAARPEQAPASVLGYARRFGESALGDYADEILPLFARGPSSAWRLLGPLPAEGAHPEPPPSQLTARVTSRTGSALSWSPLPPAPAADYVDLRGLAGADTEHALVYAETYLRAAGARTVLCCFGSDDGARVWWNGSLLYENRERKSASPLEKVLTLELQPGWNRLVLEIVNGTGGFGFFCRLLDPGVEIAGQPR